MEKKKEKGKKEWNHSLPPWQSNGADEPGPKSRVADGDLKTARDLAAIVAAVGQLKEAGKRWVTWACTSESGACDWLRALEIGLAAVGLTPQRGPLSR